VLAGRAATAGSVARSCEQLIARQPATAEALRLLDPGTKPVPKSAIDQLLGIDAADDLAALARLAMGSSSDGGINALPALRAPLGPFPAGLGRSLPTPADADVAAMLDELPDDEKNVLTKLATGAPIGRTRDASVDVDLESARTPVQRLLARGLL